MSKNGKTVLALCAHPDDAEFRCGGTLLLLAQRGWQVHIATVSAGDCGSAEETSEAIMMRRRLEARKAAARLGGVYHCLDFRDFQVYDDNSTRAAAVALIRHVNPDCVITHHPADYMADHVATSAVARMSVFAAPTFNYAVGIAAEVEPSTKGVVPLYYCAPLEDVDFLGNHITPHFYVDISSVIEEKASLLACHESQREWLRRHHGMDKYIDQMMEWDAEAGAMVGVRFAEGFSMHKGHAYSRVPVIQEALEEFIHVAGMGNS